MTAPGFERERPATGPIVQRFADGRFSVDGRLYDGVLLTPERVMPWTAPPLEALEPRHVEELIRLEPQPEFLILGTGSRMHFPPRPFTEALDRQGIGVESMDSRAAARTWGMLRQEQRWIVAALMPLD